MWAEALRVLADIQSPDYITLRNHRTVRIEGVPNCAFAVYEAILIQNLILMIDATATQLAIKLNRRTLISNKKYLLDSISVHWALMQEHVK